MTQPRSLLFVPGDRPERFDKARQSGAHGVILDLEDAVSPTRKNDARDHVHTWLEAGIPAIVRVNAADTDWFDDDLRMVRAHKHATVMLPKAEPDALSRASARMSQEQTDVIALIESVRGVLALHDIAVFPRVKRLAFGSVDFSLDSGIADSRDTLVAIRTQIVLASSIAGLQAPIDGVSLSIDDVVLIRDDAHAARRAGFGGKLCIHPKQVPIVNAEFAPTREELNWAQEVISAHASNPHGAISLHGKMIDRPVIETARRLLRAAAAI